jgi:hypothetical protein
MTPSWALIITPLGAVLAALLGVIVGGRVRDRSHDQRWSREGQMEACDEVFCELSRLMIGLAQMCGYSSSPASTKTSSARIDWNPWNDALWRLNTKVAPELVAHAHAIDEEIWRAHHQIQAGLSSPDEWFSLRDTIDIRRLAFVNAVRLLIAGQEPLDRLSGRPNPNDPIWKLGQPGDTAQAVTSQQPTPKSQPDLP